MISSLGDLRIVPLDYLILHEDHDRKRLARLRDRVQEEQVQRNPVIVSHYEDRYLVLDGAHRVHALREIGCSLVLVQVVELPEKAEGWGHLLSSGDVTAALDRVRGVEVSSEEPANGWLARVETGEGARMFVRAAEGGLISEARALCRLWGAYPEDAAVRRLQPVDPVRLAGDEAVIFYRGFTPVELAELVQAEMVLPAGITRFRIPERVLGVRFPLEKLDGDPETREAELRAFVEERWEANRIRYYGEPVVLFE